jgi:hypothetical protein
MNVRINLRDGQLLRIARALTLRRIGPIGEKKYEFHASARFIDAPG